MVCGHLQQDTPVYSNTTSCTDDKDTIGRGKNGFKKIIFEMKANEIVYIYLGDFKLDRHTSIFF